MHSSSLEDHARCVAKVLRIMLAHKPAGSTIVPETAQVHLLVEQLLTLVENPQRVLCVLSSVDAVVVARLLRCIPDPSEARRDPSEACRDPLEARRDPLEARIDPSEARMRSRRDH